MSDYTDVASNDIDRFTRTAVLYDFYSPLLTAKQREIIELYFMQNLSLSEIAELLGVTRQGVNILLKRTEKLLLGYEKRLSLIAAHENEVVKREKILHVLEGVITLPNIDDKVKDSLKEVVLFFR